MLGPEINSRLESAKYLTVESLIQNERKSDMNISRNLTAADHGMQAVRSDDEEKQGSSICWNKEFDSNVIVSEHLMFEKLDVPRK
jgi:hypothetical protein